MKIVIFVTVTGVRLADGTRVPLDDYYFGSQEGDPNYHEEKGEYRYRVCMILKYILNIDFT